MASRKNALEPVRVIVDVRPRVAIDLLANAALRWLCRFQAAPAPRAAVVFR